jgi:hypothetical protein
MHLQLLITIFLVAMNFHSLMLLKEQLTEHD